MGETPPYKRESTKHSKDHLPLNSRQFFMSLSLCFPTSKIRLKIYKMIKTCMKYLAQCLHTLYDHLTKEGLTGTTGLPGVSGGGGG